MAKKKDKPQVINNIQELNLEIDYDKLAEAIVKANKGINNPVCSEDITNAIIKAHDQESTNVIKSQEEERREKRIKLEKALELENCLDEQGNLKNRESEIKLVWKFLFLKEEFLKENNVLGLTINSIVALLFLLIEWALYIISCCLCIQGGYNIFKFIQHYTQVHSYDYSYVLLFVSCFIYALAAVLLSRSLVRMLKIDAKYNKDSNYMLNFLAVIIAVIATIISIVVR